MIRQRREWLLTGAIAIGIFLLLSVATVTETGVSLNYLVGVLIVMGIYALFALGLNLEFGHAGLINFGHVLSMLLGAYTMAILVPRLEGLDPPLSVLLQGFAASGFLASLGLAALAAAAVALPLLAWAARAPAGLRRSRRTWGAWATTLLVGVGLLVAVFPLGPRGATVAVVLLSITLGVFVAAGAGYLLGLASLRLRDDYLAIVTIGAAEIVRSAAVNEEWLTQGTLGIQRLHRPLVDWALGSAAWNRFADALDVRPVALAHLGLILALVALAYVLLETIARSPWGRALRAIREDEDVAAALGKDVRRFKLQALMIGSGVGALAGVLLVWHLSNVYPEHFLPLVTFYAFIIVIVGGAANQRGVLVGSLILWGVFEFVGSLSRLEQVGFRSVAGPPQGILIGLLIILIMMFRPQGILGRKEEMPFVR